MTAYVAQITAIYVPFEYDPLDQTGKANHVAHNLWQLPQIVSEIAS